MYCTNCGNLLPENACLCMKCGCAVDNRTATTHIATHTAHCTATATATATAHAQAPSPRVETEPAGCFDQQRPACPPSSCSSSSNSASTFTEHENAIYSKKNGITALLMLLILGMLGIHRFYLGRIWSGVLMCLIFLIGYIPYLMGSIAVSGSFHYGTPMYSQFDFVSMAHHMWSLLLLIPVAIWWFVDLGILLSGNFRDGENLKVKL